MAHGTRACLSLLATLALLAPSAARSETPRARPGELIVRYRPGSGDTGRLAARSTTGVTLIRRFARFDMDLVRVDERGVEEARARLAGDPRVLYVEPNWEYHADRTPNDPRFGELWGLSNTGLAGGLVGADIRALRAWDLFTGDPDLRIGVIDTGVDYNHPDLAANIWTNPGEIPGNQVDDDGNGYIDDIHGWDAAYDDADPIDDHGHGTHVAGTIAAVGNNEVGVTGVCWRAKIVAIKFLDSNGNGSTAVALDALQYAIATGVKVTNNSWGGGGYSQALLDAINEAGRQGQLFVAAAGNSASDLDRAPHYPATYSSPYLISVAASDNRDHLASFSNYGGQTVDLAAPGNAVVSLAPGGGYRALSGTSMAAPHVTGVVALAMGQFPLASNLVVRQQILATADRLPSLLGRVRTGARLNAFLTLAVPDSTDPGRVSDLAIEEATSNGFVLTWSATGDDGDRGRATTVDLRWAAGPILDDAAFAAANRLSAPQPDSAYTPQVHEVRGLSFETTYWLAMKVSDEFGNQGPLSNTVSGTTLVAPELEVSPLAVASEVYVGGVGQATISLRNLSGGTLDFRIPTPDIAYGQPAPFDPIPTPKDAADARVGPPVLDGRGGPDGFGYRWIDNRESGGPVYDWQDISTTGTRITLAGDEASTSGIPIGFSFPFYGNSFTSFRITTNGYLSFTETNSAYDNQPLPSFGAPQNLVAPFWDDLILGPSSNVYVFTDGTRCIVTWERASAFPQGGPFTFQLILDPTGEIRFQYGAMGDPDDRATVGIQNATRLIGLAAVFNTAYVDSGLAIRFVPTQQWLTIAPASGRLHAGESRDLTASFSAFGLDGGSYQATLQVLSNDPDEDSTRVAADLQVIGAPDVRVIPAALDFGTVFVGQRAARTLTVTNTGTDHLEITAMTSGDPDVTVEPATLGVDPREVKRVMVTYAPTAVRDLATDLVLASNDPDESSFAVPLRGQGRTAPSVLIEPDSLAVALLTDQTTQRTLRLTNSGGSEFIFTAAAGRAAAGVAPGERVRPGTRLAAASAPKVDPRVERSGGPDRFGYTYRDSDETGGPVFDWVDIRTSGTQLNLLGEDGNVGPIEIGFDFPFYGNTFSTLRVCLNGWISFTNSSSGRANYPLPSQISVVPENLIAIYWDDLAFGLQRRAWYRNDGSRVIVQFQEAYRSGETASYGNTFQAILYPSGAVVLQYKTLMAVDNQSATVGIQNQDRDDGLQIAFNEPYLRDSLAIRIQPPSRFVSVSPGVGVVPAGGFLDLDVTFDATGLFGGSYDGEVRVAGNDPGIPEQVVRTRLDVTGAPQMSIVPGALDFATVFTGFPQVRELRITNLGTDQLQISDIAPDDPAYTVDRRQLTLEPLASTEVFVTLGGLEPGNHPATLTVRSNDPDDSHARAALSGEIVEAPSIDVAPAAITAALTIPEVTTRTLALRNTGGSDLHFSVVTLFGIVPAAPPAAGGPATSGRGGPDTYGYNWRDSDQPGGPEFEWIDIQSIGTQVVLPGRGDDETARDIPIGFDFPFYGTVHRTVNLCSNGWLSFTNTSVSPGNQTLPSAVSGAPENLLAAFWDDLNPGNSAVRIWTWTNGARFVASWVGVLRTGSGGPYTFQVVLEPSGRILYQYRAMRGLRLNEATIGIQNGARDDGLTVVHNAQYVHDSLAVEFRSVPEYVRVRPESGTVPAGGSLDLEVELDSRGLFGATYSGSLRFVSDDPHHGNTVVPVELIASGEPDIRSDPAELDFGAIFAGARSDQVVRLSNAGTDTLHVTSLGILGRHGVPRAYSIVSAPPVPFSIGPRYPAEVVVRFAPGSPCSTCVEMLVVATDDPDEAPFGVALAGRGLPPPEIDGLPPGLRVVLDPAQGNATFTRSLVVHNRGGSDLEWNATSYSELPSVLPVPGALREASAASPEDPKGVDGAPGNVSVASLGGPDAAGYRWTDSDEPMSTPFHWEDITRIGTRIPLETDDQTIGPLVLPFSFPFYGQRFDSIRVCSNGWLSFTSNRTNYTNVTLPNAAPGIPENLVAAFWEDLTYNVDRGDAFYHYDGEKAIFSFHRVRRYGGDAFVTFQVLLYPSGTIDFQYLDMAGRTNNATIGIQNANRSIGLLVAYNTQYVKNGLRTRIAPRGGWLSVTPASGRVAPGGSDTLRVSFDAEPYADGDYAGSLRIASNDVDEASVELPCAMHVERTRSRVAMEHAAGEAAPVEFALRLGGGNPVQGDVALELALPAAGAPEVCVYDVRGAMVRRLTAGPLTAGRHLVRWNGEDASGRPSRPGVYFVRATMPGEKARVVRVVKLQ